MFTGLLGRLTRPPHQVAPRSDSGVGLATMVRVFRFGRFLRLMALAESCVLPACELRKNLEPFLDLCVSSLRRGHANLLCIFPILTVVPKHVRCDLYAAYVMRADRYGASTGCSVGAGEPSGVVREGWQG